MDWTHVVELVIQIVTTCGVVYKAFTYLANKMDKTYSTAVKEAILAHREDASATEARFIKIEQKQDSLSKDHQDTRDQLHEIKDMLGEIREALFSKIK